MTGGRIPLAMVGLRFGQHLIDGALLTGEGAAHFSLAALCDSDPERLSAASGKYGVPGHSSLDDVLADPGIPAICLITPPAGRAELIRRCIRAGKHVLTTKPFELDPDAARSVLAEARSLRRVVQLNSPSPLLGDDLRAIRAWARERDLGRPVMAHWSTHVAYAESADGSWYDDPLRCPVAPIFRLGIYAINDLLALLDDPVEVQVMSTRIRTGRPTPDNALLSIRFASGVLANLQATFACGAGSYPDSLTVLYERGAAYRNALPRTGDAPGTLDLFAQTADGSVQRRSSPISGPSSHAYRWEHFRRSIEGTAQPDDIDDGRIVDAVRVVQAMGRAAETGRPALV